MFFPDSIHSRQGRASCLADRLGAVLAETKTTAYGDLGAMALPPCRRPYIRKNILKTIEVPPEFQYNTRNRMRKGGIRP